MSDAASTDAELLADATGGNERAFEILVRRHIRRAVLLSTQLLGDRDEADDVVQEAFTIVYRDRGGFDASPPFPAWLFGIVRRLAANRLARERRRRLLSLWRSHDDDARATPPLDDAVGASLEAEEVDRALASLPPMQRACFELVALRGLAPREVAEMHDISESTVRQHVFRARATLKGRS